MKLSKENLVALFRHLKHTIITQDSPINALGDMTLVVSNELLPEAKEIMAFLRIHGREDEWGMKPIEIEVSEKLNPEEWKVRCIAESNQYNLSIEEYDAQYREKWQSLRDTVLQK